MKMTKKEKQQQMTTKKYLRRIDRDLRWIEGQLNPDITDPDWFMLYTTA